MEQKIGCWKDSMRLHFDGRSLIADDDDGDANELLANYAAIIEFHYSLIYGWWWRWKLLLVFMFVFHFWQKQTKKKSKFIFLSCAWVTLPYKWSMIWIWGAAPLLHINTKWNDGFQKIYLSHTSIHFPLHSFLCAIEWVVKNIIQTAAFLCKH